MKRSPTYCGRRRRFLLPLLTTLALLFVTQAAPAAPEHYRVVACDTAQQPIPADEMDRIDTTIFPFARVVDGRVTLNDAARARLAQRTAPTALMDRMEQSFIDPDDLPGRTWFKQ